MKKAASNLITSILMVRPQHFTVKYKINRWMGGTVDLPKAQGQWNSLKSCIESLGVQVNVMEQASDLPDMVFVCNSGIVYGDGVYLSKFRHKERTGEQSYYAQWFQKHGYKLYGTDYPETFEGGGDAVFSDSDTLWAGWGHRTSQKAYEHIKMMGNFDVVYCELIDPLFYHLDTCFAPIGSDSALWYPPAFSNESQKEIRQRLPRSVAISTEEANAFVCNSIAVKNTVISPCGMTEKTRKSLEDLGYTTVQIDMSEFMKSGGACQCLVMRL